MQIVNLTPHPITIEGMASIPSAGVARVAALRQEKPAVAGIRVIAQSWGQVEGLPQPQDGVIYVVSALVLGALNGSRPDVFAPDTGADAVRNEKGHIVAVRGLVQ